ncbi:MAG: pentapeptide repeat-containing protein [Alphaproteobacteria bacterium]|nr:pentapeptide repeat-containing protein [Alphaproteobacteria bacterium]
MKRLGILAAATLLALPAIAQSPEANEAARKVNAARVSAGASCAGCDLFQSDFSYQDLVGRDFSAARLRQADLSVVTADRSLFRGSDLSIVKAYGGRFEGADFSRAILEDGVFVGAYFGGARFDAAKLEGANFSGADLRTAAGLTQQQLASACGDGSTQLPRGLILTDC